MKRRPRLAVHDIPAAVLAVTGPVREIEYPAQGDTSDVAMVDAAHGRLVLKRARELPYRDWLAHENAVLRALAGLDLPVPRAHGFVKHDTERGPECWLVLDWLPGTPLAQVLARRPPAARRRALLGQFGHMLARIHRSPIPAALAGGEAWLASVLSQAAFALDHYAVDGTPGLLDELRRRPPLLVPATLMHGDYTIDNVLFLGGRPSAVIDWSGGAAGDPRYDLALAVRPSRHVFVDPGDREAFFDGYGLRMLSDEEYGYFNRLYDFF